MTYHLIIGWRADDTTTLPALRQCYAYGGTEGPDRATGYLFDAGGRDHPTPQPRDWPAPLATIGPALLGHLYEDTGIAFTVACFQAYLDGAGVGWHTDAEWDAQAILSLGVTRTLSLRKDGERYDLPMAHGDLLVMPPGFQQEWEHCVPVEDVTGERCSIVFRSARQS